ncbi:MAG TPA: sigma-70 family RNA polymerase sigma factor [Gemmataceae bacterium]|jgi:RNA polymerase sigma factor (sigma-70 family)
MSPRSAALLSQLRRLTSTPPGDAELLHRWVERRDEDAFTALVSRHGRMVQGVCRRLLGNSHDAEDAFQAVFLLLARKAGAIRHPEALPGWLHGVAVRLAYKARAAARRHPSNERAAEPCDPHPDPLDALSARELLVLIDREIARLPEAYRLPLVLCDLEDRTQTEAARLLGWSLGSLRGRLLRGRARLRMRLTRRGIAPAVLTAAYLKGTADAGGLTMRFSMTEVSPSVAALVREGVRGMMLAKLKLVSVILLTAGALAAGAGMLARHTPALPPVAEAPTESQPAVPLAAAPARPDDKSQARTDRYGDPLPDEAAARLGTLRFRHGGHIQLLAFLPDGKSLLGKGTDGVRVWDIATGKEVRRILASGSPALSPDGKLIALADGDRKERIGVWDVATGKLVRRFGERPVYHLLFSPDGRMLAALGSPPVIELWDPATGAILRTLEGHKDQLWSAAFSPDGKTLVSGSDDKTIRFWDPATGKEVRKIACGERVRQITLSPDGKLLASIGSIKLDKPGRSEWYANNRVRIWDAATDTELRSLVMPALDIRSGLRAGFLDMRFAPDGKTLVTGGLDGMLRVWDAETGKERRQFGGFAGYPNAFAFTPDGKTLALADGGMTIRTIDLASGKDRLPLSGHRTEVNSIVFTADGRAIVTAGWDGALYFWDSATGRQLRRRTVSTSLTTMLQLLPERKSYLSVGTDKILRSYDLDNGKEIRTFRWHDRERPFALAPDGRTFAEAARDEKDIQLLNAATGEDLHTLRGAEPFAGGFTFAPDSRTLFVWSRDRTITVWDVATGQKRRQFPGPAAPRPEGQPPYFTVCLSPDGKLLAFCFQEPVLPILDAATGKEVCRFQVAPDGVSALAFSPDGKSVAWGGWGEGTVYLGELATGRERHRFVGHQGRVLALAFSADGQTLVSGTQDTTALVWDLTGRLTMGKKFGAPLSAEDLEMHWKALAANDASAGYRAVRMLASDRKRSVPYLQARLRPVARADEKRLKQWIVDLDSETFAVREKAATELNKLGAAALHALRRARAERPALETRRRLEHLIAKQEREEWSPSPERLRTRRALEVLERAGTPEAKRVLTSLADGAPGAWQTLDAKAALERRAQRPAEK